MYKIAKNCRCCGSDELVKYLDLGLQPLANSYHKNTNMSAYFPLEVMLCQQCFHSQLSIVVDPDLMFKNYLYVSGTTQTFRNHCEEFAEYVVGNHSSSKLTVLDIAANDGTLLKCFQELGCSTIGVDPANNLNEISKANGIEVINEYWNENAIRILNTRYFTNKVDVITGTNVFAHVDDTFSFLENCKKVLNDNGRIILEFPYCDKMIKNIEFDTIYHEHLSYFLVTSFATLAYKVRLIIDKVIQTPIHGGSIRFTLRKAESLLDFHCEEANALIQKEKKEGLLTLETYEDFSKKIKENKIKFNDLLANMKNKNNFKIVGYGASAKGNTMLNYFNVDLDYIVDDNPMKVEFNTPGRNIIIKKTSELKNENLAPLAIVILSWNFYEEIKEKIKNIRNNEPCVLIKYVPTIDTEMCF